MKQFFRTVVALALTICGTATVIPVAHAASVKEPDTITIAWLPNNSGNEEKVMRE